VELLDQNDLKQKKINEINFKMLTVRQISRSKWPKTRKINEINK
jgi:hypothetical protein